MTDVLSDSEAANGEIFCDGKINIMTMEKELIEKFFVNKDKIKLIK